MIKKIAVIGGESTGKSTLCAQLALFYQTIFCEEFARNYLSNLNRSYQQQDLIEIAKGQLAAEEAMEKHASNYLFCDTNLQVIQVWSEFKYKVCDQFILNKIALQNYDAYLVTSPDFPWQYDNLRENSSEEASQLFFKWYQEIALSNNKPFLVVFGSEEQRLLQASAFIEGI